MPGKAQMGKKAQCMEQSMSILSPFPTPHGAFSTACKHDAAAFKV
jgi:hypothetical protein